MRARSYCRYSMGNKISQPGVLQYVSKGDWKNSPVCLGKEEGKKKKNDRLERGGGDTVPTTTSHPTLRRKANKAIKLCGTCVRKVGMEHVGRLGGKPKRGWRGSAMKKRRGAYYLKPTLRKQSAGMLRENEGGVGAPIPHTQKPRPSEKSEKKHQITERHREHTPQPTTQRSV